MFRLDAVRQLAMREKSCVFNNLFSMLDEDLLTSSFYQLRRDAAPGEDQIDWSAYECELSKRITGLHARLHEGRYRPRPARQVFITKEDGTQRPLRVICIEDKIVQQGL